MDASNDPRTASSVSRQNNYQNEPCAANAKAGSVDKHRGEKKGDSASLSVPPNAFSQYKICVEVVQQESAPEDDPMNVLVSRMNYCFFALVAAAIMGMVHMSLRAANSMPLSEFADCVLLVMCGAGWAFVLVMVGIVHYGWSDSWKDFGIVPSVPCTFAATETVAVLVLLILIFDFVSIKVSYMNVSLRESRPYQRTSGGTDRSVYQPTTE
ncbi:hypothetical protein AAVH_07779 [Aphelenchoides avenae]|nr:hypothetical protein AAVH_07779 [Aphelenchus avenae]